MFDKYVHGGNNEIIALAGYFGELYTESQKILTYAAKWCIISVRILTEEAISMSKVLVAYFSASGVTAEKAKAIAEAAQADLYEIKPAVPYTEADLDFRNKESRSSVEMADKSIRPEFADKDANIAAYDTIFLGFPIWWYVAPTIINSFLESYDFSGKTIILFATSGGSRFGKTVSELKPSVSESTVIKEGRLLSNTQPLVIASWVKDLGY